MSLFLALAIASSGVTILMLRYGDPKRLRLAGCAQRGDNTAKRRVLAAATLLPGVLVAFAGDSAAFLVWFGACALAGWFAAQLSN